MPKRTDLKTILIIGAGPIVIGQACEFDYSGTQACRVLREEGVRVILVNSNPATIMTDPDFADATYIEPITWQVIETIIAKERPDAILPTLGGQTALNLAIDLARAGVLYADNGEPYPVNAAGLPAMLAQLKPANKVSLLGGSYWLYAELRNDSRLPHWVIDPNDTLIDITAQAVKGGFVQPCVSLVGFEKTITGVIQDDPVKSRFYSPFTRPRPADATIMRTDVPRARTSLARALACSHASPM